MKTFPGFSAAASLYPQATAYRVKAAGTGHRSGEVVPQLPAVFRCGLMQGLADAICQTQSAAACIAAVLEAERACSR